MSHKKPKKVTILSIQPTPSYEERDIQKAARKAGLSIERVQIKEPVQDLKSLIDTFGEIVIRRSVLLAPSQKSILIKTIKESGRVVINGTQDEQPFIPDKGYQQALIKKKLPKLSIPSYEVKNKKQLLRLISSKKLSFPFVMKKKISRLGKGVHLIEKNQDLKSIKSVRNFIFQNVIKNTGEYRVYIVGQRTIGAIKKQATDGSFFNNVAQNAKIFSITDPEIKSEVYKTAERIANHFAVDVLAVDILESIDGKKYFLEVNTGPNWTSQKFLNLNETIGEKIINLGISLYKQKTENNLSNKGSVYVQHYYDSNIEDLHRFKFHYLSRMYLWTNKKFYKKHLDLFKKEIIGNNRKEILSKLIYKPPVKNSTSPKKKRREKYEKHYVLNEKNYALFKYLFAQSVYNKDISHEILTILDKKELIKTYNELYNDQEALINLSTPAINFLYLTRELLGKIEKKKLPHNPQHFLDTVRTNYKNDTSDLTFSLKLYLLTHTIIGESLFYQRPVKDARYHNILKEAEKMIAEYYFNIPFDNKIEFLVCAKLCNTKSYLEPIILNEASKSFSPLGNFIIETQESSKSNMFGPSEHRNVLYIMATTPFKPKK